MDLEIGGASAIVCASSKGLGFACAAELAREGASVVICGRHADTLEDARRQIAERGGAVTAVVAARARYRAPGKWARTHPGGGWMGLGTSPLRIMRFLA